MRRPATGARATADTDQATSATGWHGPYRLRAQLAGQVPLDVAAKLLGPDAAAWLGQPAAESPPGMRRFAVDLRLRQNDSTSLPTVHKAAFVDVGSVQQIGDNLRAEISWRSATLAPLFPVFSGWLTVGLTELLLDGYYAPPGGTISLAADEALLHVAARGSAQWLLRELRRAADSRSVRQERPATLDSNPPS